MGRTKTTEAQELARQLDIDLARAQELLSYTDGDRVQAAALHRAEHGTSRAGPSNDQSSGSSSRPNELQKAVQEMGLPSITLQQANSLLKVAGNSVERAVELYLETPSSAGPRGRVSAAAPDNDEPIVIGSSSNEDEGESEGTSDSEDDSNREGSQEDSDGGNTNGAPLPALLNRLFQPLANEPSTSDSSFSSSSSDDDDDDIDTGSSDSDSDDSGSGSSDVEFETEVEVWAAAVAAYDEHFKQQGEFALTAYLHIDNHQLIVISYILRALTNLFFILCLFFQWCHCQTLKTLKQQPQQSTFLQLRKRFIALDGITLPKFLNLDSRFLNTVRKMVRCMLLLLLRSPLLHRLLTLTPALLMTSSSWAPSFSQFIVSTLKS